MNGFARPDELTHAVGCAFAAAGFVPPAEGAAGVLVFDSARWVEHQAAAEARLDAGERQRAARFRFDRDRSTYLLAHAVWRMALGTCLGVDAADVPLRSSPSGQPLLPGTPWATSLSHSGGWVAMAMARAATVGVDIERSPSPRALNDLMPTICTPAEAVAMRRLPLAAREAALLALWTRKEALLKAFGTGLTVAPTSFAVNGAEPVASPVAGLPSCRVFALGLPVALVGALALPLAVGDASLHLLDQGGGPRVQGGERHEP